MWPTGDKMKSRSWLRTVFFHAGVGGYCCANPHYRPLRAVIQVGEGGAWFSGLGDDVQTGRLGYIGVQLDINLELAHFTQGAFR